ncbi:uncharacterized protein N7473_007047 [Penicillium subrubescens]|uniref:uncharacterized protein n=1 Tax=Penicillium subrubescens TaxID=1316194 RepID=UPI00254554B2|nr:uncharacterized protein N7473_007047 [Penicillium subrubescens]KAJ5890819.1 hypothetical protein N7473_007047 [Penicillium subrubescens]
MDLFQRLPTEVLCLIVDELLPVGWDKSQEGRDQLEKRPLCKRFDAVISYRANKRIDLSHLMMVAPTMTTDTAVWLLYQKVLAEGTTEVEHTVTPPDAASLPARCGGSIQSYLLWACQLALVRSLVAGGADINECDEFLGSPLVAATLGHQGDIARLLFRLGADAEQGVVCVGSSFIVAARLQMKKLVRLFLRGKKVNPNQRDISGYTALYWCSRYGDADLVRLLLDHPSIDLQSDNHGRDALACAAAEGHEEIVQWLVGHDEIQTNNHDGLSLFKAVARGHEKVATDRGRPKRPREHHPFPAELPGNRSKCQNLVHPSALCVASKKGSRRMVKMLLAHKDIKVNEWGAKNRTSLSLAARHGHDDVFRLLLDHDDIDLGLADISGMLPLMHASRKVHAKIVRLLLLYWPSSIDVKDNFGKTSLMVAARHGHLDVVQVLLEFDADVSLKDHFYQTALDCARERKHPGIETLLLQASAEATRSERSGASSVSTQTREQATKVKITSQILRLSVFVTCCLLFIVSCVWRLPRLDRRNA